MNKKLLSALLLPLAMQFNAQNPGPYWQTLQSTNYTMTSACSKFLKAVSPNVVWSVGYGGTAVSQNYNTFSRSINGGTTFNTGNIFSDTNTYVISNLEAIDANTAWVCSFLKAPQAQGAIHQTTNGGATWTNMTAAGMFTNSASFGDFIAFLTPSVGIALGDPIGSPNTFEIWRTTNAGATWAMVPSSNIPVAGSGEYGLVNLYAKYGSRFLWFGTNKGRVYRSTDAGQTYSVATLPGTPTASLQVQNLAFTDSLNGIAAVYNTSITPAVFEEYITNNGGASWTKVMVVDPKFGKNHVAAVQNRGIFVSAANSSTSTALSYSKDGGKTWTDWGTTAIPFIMVEFADSTSGWAATFQTSTLSPTGGLYKFNGANAIFSTSSNTVCLASGTGTNMGINNSLGNAPMSYSWSVSPAAAISNSNSSSPVFTYTSSGTYSITLITSNSFTNSTTTQTVFASVCSSPTVNFVLSAAVTCTGVAVTSTNNTTGSAPINYQWGANPSSGIVVSPGPTASNPTFTFNLPGTYTISLTASNVSGSVQAVQVLTVSTCVGLKDLALNEVNFNAYPNPAQSELNIALNAAGKYQIKLTNILGSVVYNSAIDSNKTEVINLANFSKGIYFITIEGENKKSTKKIIVE